MSAEVALVYRVLPDSVEIDIDKLKEAVVSKLTPKYKVDKVEVEEIGFGIKALRFLSECLNLMNIAQTKWKKYSVL